MTDKEILIILENLDNDLSKIDHNIPTGSLYLLIEEFTKRAQQEQQDDNYLLANSWGKL